MDAATSAGLGEEEGAVARSVRVQQLEDMVRKLESENKALLHRVRSPASVPSPQPTGSGTPDGDERKEEEEEEESDTLSLGGAEEGRDDEW